MQHGTESSTLFSFLPLLIMSIPLGITSRKLAEEKGRNVTLWTVLGFIPILNYICIVFFIGAANLRIERKLDHLIERLHAGELP
jgi:hypothetical protein